MTYTTKAGPRHHNENPAASSTPSSATNEAIVSGYVKRTPGKRGVWLLIVPTCPYCGRKHTHGAPYGLDTIEEHQLSHCRDGGKPYVIVVSEAA